MLRTVFISFVRFGQEFFFALIWPAANIRRNRMREACRKADPSKENTHTHTNTFSEHGTLRKQAITTIAATITTTIHNNQQMNRYIFKSRRTIDQ